MPGRNARRTRSRALRDAILARDITATALIEAGVEVDPRDTEHGETGLMLAAQAGSEELVRLLLERGAEVNARDAVYGRTALGFALWSRSLVVMQMLVAADADINARDGDGLTVLMRAAEAGEEEIVAWLIANGADVRAENAGETALTLARGDGYSGIVDLLKRAGRMVGD
jgi:ankyrin repeat protein